MTAAVAIDMVAVFRARCAARAHLVTTGSLDFHDAVDGLQAAAGPVIDLVGQDQVQAIMAAAFRDVPRGQPSGRPEEPTCDDYGLGQGWDNSPMPEPTLLQPADEPETGREGAAQSTVDALLYAMRRGLSCLDNPANRRRLTDCNSRQVKAIVAELRTWPGLTADGKPRPWLPAWPKGDRQKLIELWRTAHDARD